MILKPGQLPAAPRGHRIIVRPFPKEEESQIIVTPDDQKHVASMGTLVAAGMNARDQMHDHGDQLGDVIWWGKFAGVIGDWDTIDNPGKGWEDCDHSWTRQNCDIPRQKEWKCDQCKSTRIAYFCLVMNVDDILTNVSLQRRIEAGAVAIERGKTPDGRTQHYIDRKDR